MNPYAFTAFTGAITVDRVYGWVEFGLSAIVILGILIVAHEFGHFIVARLVGVRVEVFSIGFGRKIVSRQYGNTEYALSMIPLGGYVKFYGDEQEEESQYAEDSFPNQPVWKRLAIVFAGPFFNIILAVLVIAMAAMIGLPEISMTIDKVNNGSPAMTAGLEPGDRITAIEGKTIESWGQLQNTIAVSPGKTLSIGVKRPDGHLETLTITPEKHTAKTIGGKEKVIGMIGVIPRQVTRSYPVHQAFIKGAQWTWNVTAMTFQTIGKLVTRDIPANQLAGPIGIMQLAGQAASYGFTNLLMFISLISVNLGVLNLLPIPVLDGGHIFFYTIEMILGKPLNIKSREIAQQVGIVMLLMMMALAFYNDIARIING